MKRFVRYEFFVIVGIAMTIGTLVKLLGIYNFSSDWFWFIAGVGLTLEGAICLIKQRQFDKKYKIIEVGSEEHKKFCSLYTNPPKNSS